MEMMKLLGEAKANGLSKEEFFHLVELEFKMNESKKQASGGNMSNGDGLASGVAGLEKLLQETCDKMENQQKQQHQMFVEVLDKQKQYLQNEFRRFQQQQETQMKGHQQILAQQNELQMYNSQVKGDLSGRSEGSLDSAVLNMKDKFLEMRNTVLNRLEEEKIFMRDALSKAQTDILTLLSKTGQDVSHIKEAIGENDIAQIGKQVSQIRLLCEEQTQQKNVQDDRDEKAEGSSQEMIQDSLKILFQDLKTKIDGKLEESVDSLKQEVKEMKEAQSPKLPDKLTRGDSMQKDDRLTSYYFCINRFKNCLKFEQSIDINEMYVDKLRAHVKGLVQFVSGDMQVWLSYVCRPGESHRDFKFHVAPRGKISVKAVITDLSGNLPDKAIGEKTFDLDTLSLNSERPFLIGGVKCDEIIKDGYVLYSSGAVLLKYEIVF